jgi:hypothetical protein
MELSGCGFDRAHSRPAKTIKGVKKAAYCSEMLYSPQSLARRLAPPSCRPLRRTTRP